MKQRSHQFVNSYKIFQDILQFLMHQIFFLKKKKSCPGNNDFSEVIKNRLLHGMDLNFYDDEKM